MRRALLLTLAFALAACQTRTVHETKTAPKAAGKARPGKPKVTKSASPPPNAPTNPPAPSPISEDLRRATENEKSGRLLEALKDYLAISVGAPTATEQESARLKALDILETKLDESSLRKVGGDSDYGFLRGHALYQLGRRAIEQRNPDDAKKYFTGVMNFLPGTDLAFQAETMLSQLESVKYVEPKTIGVVLPLSGKNAAVGQRALRGIEMGLGLNELNSNFRLAVMDSEGNPDTARRGVERLVREDNVIAIIGSLLSKTAPAVASKADELGVPTIGLSQRPGLTETGPSVFRNALTGEMQVRQLVRTAMDELGLRRFAILAPNDAYGIDYANAFWDEVLARGGRVTAAQIYDPKETDFRAVCQRLVNTWYLEGREDEYHLLIKEKTVASDGRKKSIRQEKDPDDLLPPLVDFDAVFIPDSAKMMGTLAAFMSYAGVRNVKLLGTNLWSSPGVGKKAGLFADQLIFVDSGNFDLEGGRMPPFATDYKRVFNEPPTMIEIQAYDSAQILRQLISKGVSTREQLIRQLADLRDVPGVLGPLEMSDQREVRRPLTTYQTVSGNPVPFVRKAR